MRTPVQQLTSRVAWVFLVLGALGCLPGVTTHLDDVPLTGPGGAALFGLLPVTVAGNVVHFAAAAAGALAAARASWARDYLRWAGAVYSLLCLRSIAVGTAASNPHVAGDAGLWTAFSWGVLVLVLGVLATIAGGLRDGGGPVAAGPGGTGG
jgi:hypothetical protein